jgi:hypothetical protein
MLFINPMWDSESQRIGLQKCTPLGYALHALSDLVGFAALLSLVATPCYLGYAMIVGTFESVLLWLFPISFAMAVLAKIMHRFSWWLAQRQGFRYDYECREASWLENGQRRSYMQKEVA